MSKSGEVFKVRSVMGTHFTGALIQNAGEQESLDLPTNVALTGVSSFIIENISVISDQNLDWDVFIWGGTGAASAVLDTNTFRDYVSFANTDGKQIAGAGIFYYPSADLEIVYIPDAPGLLQLHCGLVNRNAGAKNAGATGEIVVEFTCRILR